MYTPILFGWARGLGLQDSDAADLVQEVFAIVLKEMPAFVYDRKRSFRAWLKTVALNRWRSRGRKARLPTAPGADPDHVPGQSEEAFWEDEYRRQLAARALTVMKSEFEDTTWRACLLLVVEGKSAGQAAEILGLSPGAVRVAKSRVLRRLRQELEGMLD